LTRIDLYRAIADVVTLSAPPLIATSLMLGLSTEGWPVPTGGAVVSSCMGMGQTYLQVCGGEVGARFSDVGAATVT